MNLTLLLAPLLLAASANELVTGVLNSRTNAGFRARVRLTTQSGSCQVLVKGRRDGEANVVIYQAVWPENIRGRAVVLQNVGQELAGFTYTPPAEFRPLVATEPFFGTDLTMEDLAESFWSWPVVKITGTDKVLNHPCAVVDLQSATTGVCPRVSAWIATDIHLPLQLHRYAADGQLVRSITATKLLRQSENRWRVATFVVENPVTGLKTIVEGAGLADDISLPVQELSLERIQATLRSVDIP
jgi:hypothetical protein